MNQKQYICIIDFFKKNKFRENTINFFCKYSSISVVIIYFFTIFYLFLEKDKRMFLFILIPALNFIFVTIIRRLLNKPRPYDELNYVPLVKFKKGKGKSFPSRHTASAFIIAIACLYLNIYFGAFMIILASLIGISRIITGVHYPKDILFGILISFIFGYLGFFIL